MTGGWLRRDTPAPIEHYVRKEQQVLANRWSMNLKQLETFVAIVQLGSFNAAAERLNATQSTVSARIHELEQLLGTTLFDRSARRALLTAKGRELVAYAERMLALSTEIKLAIGDANAFSGVVRMGVAEIVAVTWLPDMVAAVRAQYPKLILQVDVSLNPGLMSKLASGEMDIAIIAGARSEIPFEARDVGSVQFAWLASGLQQLPRKRWKPRELSEMPLIFQGAESATRRLMSQWLGDEVVPGPRSICNSMAGIASLAAAGVGIGFLPLDYHADRIADGSLQKLETTPKAPSLPFSIAYQSRPNTKILQMLSDHAVRASTFRLSQ